MKEPILGPNAGPVIMYWMIGIVLSLLFFHPIKDWTERTLFGPPTQPASAESSAAPPPQPGAAVPQ
jgi:hypothetical protein